MKIIFSKDEYTAEGQEYHDNIRPKLRTYICLIINNGLNAYTHDD